MVMIKSLTIGLQQPIRSKDHDCDERINLAFSDLPEKFSPFVVGEFSNVLAPGRIFDWIDKEQRSAKFVPPLVALAPHEHFILTTLVHLRKVDGTRLNMSETLVILWLDYNYDIR